MPSIKVSEAFEKLAEQVSDERNITVADACDVIGECAVGRWNALRRHATKKRKARDEAAAAAPTAEPASA